jgi:hypothetical protein
MMKISLCKLRDIGILQNDGKLHHHPDLNNKQTLHVIKYILNVINNQDIDDYLETNMNSGHLMYKPFPDCIVYQIIDSAKIQIKELIANKYNNVNATSTDSTYSENF